MVGYDKICTIIIYFTDTYLLHNNTNLLIVLENFAILLGGMEQNLRNYKQKKLISIVFKEKLVLLCVLFLAPTYSL